MICINCGKLIPDNSICNACGTDYRKEPECDHFYNKYCIEFDIRYMCYVVYFKCNRCGHVEKLSCDCNMIDELKEHKILNIRYRGEQWNVPN